MKNAHAINFVVAPVEDYSTEIFFSGTSSFAPSSEAVDLALDAIAVAAEDSPDASGSVAVVQTPGSDRKRISTDRALKVLPLE
jgi:hypothetical protein